MLEKFERKWKKKQERKAMVAKSNAIWASVKKANEQEDPLAALPSFQAYKKNDVNLSLEARKVKDLDAATRDWIVDLMERNLKEVIDMSECCWSATKQTDLLEGKRKELLGEGAWFLIARDADTKIPLAFSHFRYVMDYNDDVLYCYEIQLEQSVRRKGLGKIMVSVFKTNAVAMKFFKDALKYELDETSPDEAAGAEADVEILSRFNPKEKKKRDDERAAAEACCPPVNMRRAGGG